MIFFSNKQCQESVDITLIPILTTGKTFLEFYNRNFNIQLPNTYVYAGFFCLMVIWFKSLHACIC